ncbi:MAG: phage major capsid protein [Bacteroidales bacterium]|nr:phage major capsid protein [Bacteroidales bacterium]
MKKNNLNVRELVEKYQANCDRINEIADACEKEQRGRTEAESKEFETLARENQLLSMRMQAATAEHLRQNPNAKDDAVKLIRENAKVGRKTEIILVREGEFTGMMVADAAAGGIIPLNVQDILKPLQEGFILDKVGLPMPTGLAGDFVWPIYEAVDATILGEGVALGDTKIDLDKLTAAPERIGIAIPVTNQALNQSTGVLEMIIREVMPDAIRQLLNKIVFSPVKVTGATNLVGPFANIVLGTEGYAPVVPLSATPTFQELNKLMKAAVLEKGINGENMCWIMTKSMQALLEGEPINSRGVYVPMVQNGMLCGLPIYTTNCLRNGNVEYIGLGDWRYQPMGLFGTIRFIVDPYSQARRDSVDFVLNTDYATKTVRPEAFILGQVAGS